MKKELPKVVVVCGPTATGKSDLAVLLALRFDGEVVSADSRQVYRGLDTGAGKITESEMKGVRHHLLDVADPAKARYSVEDFQREASVAIEDIISRGKLPIICGGTGFYIDTLIYGTQFPSVKPNKKLREELAKESCEDLMKKLAKLDSKRARSIDPYNKVRIIRAIEIAMALGNVPKAKRTKRFKTLWIGLTADRETLQQKIYTRLEKRMEGEAMEKEVKHLHDRGVSWKRLYEFGLEYRHVAQYVQKKVTKDEMISRLKIEIVQFAKRQMTWFSREKAIRWFNPSQTTEIESAVREFLA
ncbi:MAG TPA: tRNA (adenosine(37)-N6)-dimethylallyltransferase MiaA [Candidatus Paceibacterota bacterium]|jgi:tRNA isopentenyltransferase (miaA)